MERKEAKGTCPLGMCEKVFNAIKLNPAFRSFRRISYRPEPVTDRPDTHEPNKVNSVEVGPTKTKPMQLSSPPAAAVGPISTKPMPSSSSSPRPPPTPARPPPAATATARAIQPVNSGPSNTAKPKPEPTVIIRPTTNIPSGPTPSPPTMNKPVPPTPVGLTATKPGPPNPVGSAATKPVPPTTATKPVRPSPTVIFLPTSTSVEPGEVSRAAAARPGNPSAAEKPMTTTARPQKRRAVERAVSNINEKVGDFITQAKNRLRTDSNIGEK